MPLGKQAKILTKGQVEAALAYIEKTRHPIRNRVILLLSVKAGLRAKEIAFLTWAMVTGADGKIGRAIHLPNSASKGQSGRIVPMNAILRAALAAWMEATRPSSSDHVVRTERAQRTSAQAIVNLFSRWYERLGFAGASRFRVSAARSGTSSYLPGIRVSEQRSVILKLTRRLSGRSCSWSDVSLKADVRTRGDDVS